MGEPMGSAEPDRTVPRAGCEGAPGRAEETPHSLLRRVTRPWHDGVEDAFAVFDLQTLPGLAGFLLRQAAALVPLELALERSGAAERLADWPARRRAAALAADLAGLGLEAPPLSDLPRLPTEHHVLGALYVVEGSKLGGRVLHRRAQASPDPRVRAANGFLGHRDEGGWAKFLAVLNAAPSDPSSRADLVDGARIAFASFHAAARQDPAPRVDGPPTRFGLYHRAHA